MNNLIHIATIVRGRRICPVISNLPDASIQLITYIHNILNQCNGLQIYKSSTISRRKFDPWMLLYMEVHIIKYHIYTILYLFYIILIITI